MRTLIYPCRLERLAADDVAVHFPDVPEAITGGPDEAAALAEAPDALAAAIESYLVLGHAVPSPSAAAPGDHLVALDPSVAARVLLTEAMAEQHLTKVALAAKLGQDEKAVRRMLSGKGVSLDRTLAALRSLGVHPALMV